MCGFVVDSDVRGDICSECSRLDGVLEEARDQEFATHLLYRRHGIPACITYPQSAVKLVAKRIWRPVLLP